MHLMLFMNKIDNFKNRSNAINYLKNTAWVIGERVLRMAVSLFVGIWMVRYLGPEQLGIFSYAQSIAALFVVFSTLGLDSIVIRELIGHKDRRDELLGTSFFLKLIGAFSVLFGLFLFNKSGINSSQTNTLAFIVASATIFQSFNIIDYYFQSQVLSKFVVFSNTIGLLLSSVIKIFLIINNASLIFFAYVVLFDSFILAMGLIYFYSKNGLSIRRWFFNKKTAFALLKDSWPLMLGGFVIIIYMKIDLIMINNLLGPEAVGQYSAAVKLSEVWYIIPMIICSSLFPAILNAKEKSTDLYNSRLQSLYNLMAWMAISIAVPMTFLSSWLVSTLYGTEYNQTATVLMIHIWASIFVFIGVASSKWLIAENLQKYSFYRTIAGALINIALNYVLIPMHGINGAAIATLASQMVASYLFNITTYQLRVAFVMQSKALFLPIIKIKAIF